MRTSEETAKQKQTDEKSLFWNRRNLKKPKQFDAIKCYWLTQKLIFDTEFVGNAVKRASSLTFSAAPNGGREHS